MTEKQAVDQTEKMAVAMLDTTLGIEFDDEKAGSKRRKSTVLATKL